MRMTRSASRIRTQVSETIAVELTACRSHQSVELPDKGKYGFVLDKSFIKPIVAETADGMRAFRSVPALISISVANLVHYSCRSAHIASRHQFMVPPSAQQRQKIKHATINNDPAAFLTLRNLEPKGSVVDARSGSKDESNGSPLRTLLQLLTG